MEQLEFIKRRGAKLYLGEQEFRFASINIPNLHVNEDPLPNWHRIDPWEIEDAFKTINLMGGQVTRMYTLSIRGGIRPGDNRMAHVYGPGEYEEELFKDLDKVIELAGKYKVRLIIPFIDQWDWFGGIAQFAAFRGKEASEFWTDQKIIEDFKEVIKHVINRTNSYTGIPYKLDPAIMAWETGNELDCPDSWTEEITEYIRGLDSNHLIIDGKYGVSGASLENSCIDIVSNHYYVDRGEDIPGRVMTDIISTRGKKPFIIGEFNHQDENLVKRIMEISVEEGVAGFMLWSLRYHSKDGGFYYHGYPEDPNNPCFNWPGFSSRLTGEVLKLKELRKCAYAIRNCPVPSLNVPESPELLPIETPAEIRWRGSAGAEKYILERAQSEEGPWIQVSDYVMEDMVPYVPYKDTPKEEGTYFYRMIACNEAGRSEASNIVPVSYQASATLNSKSIELTAGIELPK